MDIKSLASSSNGNAYLISDGKTSLLLECGLPYKKLNMLAGFRIPFVDGCLISHQHKDHSAAAKDIMAHGVDVWAGAETMEALGISGHRAHALKDGEIFEIGTFVVQPLLVAHDVECFSFLILSKATGERLYFAIDTHYIKYAPEHLNYIMVEVNYQQELLDKLVSDGTLDYSFAKRIMCSHMELQSVALWLQSIDCNALAGIYVMHLSNSNADEFAVKQTLQGIAGVPITIFKE